MKIIYAICVLIVSSSLLSAKHMKRPGVCLPYSVFKGKQNYDARVLSLGLFAIARTKSTILVEALGLSLCFEDSMVSVNDHYQTFCSQNRNCVLLAKL